MAVGGNRNTLYDQRRRYTNMVIQKLKKAFNASNEAFIISFFKGTIRTLHNPFSDPLPLIAYCFRFASILVCQTFTLDTVNPKKSGSSPATRLEQHNSSRQPFHYMQSTQAVFTVHTMNAAIQPYWIWLS